MNDKQLHDLAVAYAQVELAKYQQEHPDTIGYDEKISSFLESYYFALTRIPIVNKDIDVSKFY